MALIVPLCPMVYSWETDTIVRLEPPSLFLPAVPYQWDRLPAGWRPLGRNPSIPYKPPWRLRSSSYLRQRMVEELEISLMKLHQRK